MQDIFSIGEKLGVVKNQSLKSFTTIKVGGKCKYFFSPSRLIDLRLAIELFNEKGVPVKFLGNGSNVIFSDNDFNGAVISIKNLKGIFLKQNVVRVMAGESINSLQKFCLKNLLSGLEFSAGIPATIGGATTMNAGAFNSDFSAVVKSVSVLQDGYIKVYDKIDCKFKYRESVFLRKNLPIISADFSLKKSTYSQVEELTKKYILKRKKAQPSGKTCGSFFKNPKGNFAGKLIEQAGLKGFKVGGALVSPVHANFIVNTGNATAKNVFDLAQQIKEKVYANSGIKLKEEIEFIGEF